MADDTGALPPLPSDNGDQHEPRDPLGRWRGPLIATLIIVPLLAAAGGIRLGCEIGVVELPGCSATEAQASPAVAEAAIEGDTATISVTQPDGTTTLVAQEPADQFPGQFVKFVVVAPDGSRTLYVTATSLGMTEAKLWVVPRGQPKQLLKDLGDEFWVARPAWCQAQAGDIGRIAYIMKSPDPPGPGNSGLELWVINGDGTEDRRVLGGNDQNGLKPELFYGESAAPLRFLSGCQRLRYSDAADRFVVDLGNGTVSQPIGLPGAAPASPTPAGAAGGPTAPAGGVPCRLKPFAQTDPRWGNQLMRREMETIRSWGCALTSTAMIFNYYGIETNPGNLNTCAGDNADPLYWDPVRAACGGGRLTTTRYFGEAGWSDLATSLAAGRPVIVGLQGGPAGSHFLVVNSGSGNQAENYRITDSWDGSTYKTLADYINPKKGYILKWLVIYEGQPPSCTPDSGPADAAAGLITVQSPEDGKVYNAPQTIRYQANAPAGATVQSSHPNGTRVEADGIHTLTITIQNGQQTIRKRVSFIIDRSPPSVEVAWQPQSNTSVWLNLTAKDQVTRVTQAHVKVDNGEWRAINDQPEASASLDLAPVVLDGLAPGPHQVRYYAVDSAGNKSAEEEVAVTAAPVQQQVTIDDKPAETNPVAVDIPPDKNDRTVTIANVGTTAVQVTSRGGPDWVDVKPAGSKKKKKGAGTKRPKHRPGRQADRVIRVGATTRAELPAGLVALTATGPATVIGRAGAAAGDGGQGGGAVTPGRGDRASITRANLAAVQLDIRLEPGEEQTLQIELLREQLPAGQQQGLVTLVATSLGGSDPPVDLKFLVTAAGATPPTPTMTATPAPAVAGIEISTRLVRIEPTTANGQFTLRATQGAVTPFAITGGEDQAWLGLSVRQGALAADGTPLPVTIVVDRGQLGAGPAPGVILRVSSGATIIGDISLQVLFATPTPTPSVTPTPAPSETITVTPTATGTPVPTTVATVVPTATETAEPSPSPTAPVTPSVIVTASPTSSVTPTSTPTPTRTPTVSPTITRTPTSTPTATATLSPTPALNPVPQLTRLDSPNLRLIQSPNGPRYIMRLGAGNFAVSIVGSNFVQGALLRWTSFQSTAPNDLQTTFANSTALRATVPGSLSDVPTGTVYQVVVVNPQPGGGASAPLIVEIESPNPTPTIATFSGPGVSLLQTAPGYTLRQRNGDFDLLITGTNFMAGAVVIWDDIKSTATPVTISTTFISPTQIRARIPAAISAVADGTTYDVRVKNPDPGGGPSAAVRVIVYTPLL